MLGKKKNSRFDKYRTTEEVKEEEKKKKKPIYRIILTILVILCLAEGVQFYQHVQLVKTEKQWEQNLSDEKDRSEELSKKKKKMTTKEYIEKIAREKLGLFYDDEYVLEEDSSSTESSTSTK